MTMYVEDFVEGQACPLLVVGSASVPCSGTLELAPPDDCSCHISPPCNSCIERHLVCTVCGWEAEDLEP